MRVIVAILLMLTAGPLAAGELVVRSGPERTHLLELFTSEGCSSCPPAEAWLHEQGQRPGLWRSFVPVTFHVDYWNGLGWIDAFAQPQFTDRQRSYAAVWKTSRVYTPCFVLDGAEWRPGTALPRAGEKTGILEARVTPGDARIRFVPVAAGEAPRRVWVALQHAEIRSDVRAGENAGRRLIHSFAALRLIKQDMTRAGGVWSATVALPEQTGARSIAIWVTRAGGSVPEQAAGGWLPETETAPPPPETPAAPEAALRP